ncbi:MAG: ABC transporter permease [Candidatus Thorarchaeota archaeon]|nr:ABC transporter permease [Candidatus Thorarchaeota archaeon]
MKDTKPRMRGGNPFWPPLHAFRSLKNYPIRNMGIVLVLAIGIALPTTIFAWTTTGTRIAVEDYFAEEPYHLVARPKPGHSYSSSSMEAAKQSLNEHPYTEFIHLVPSTIGILAGDSISNWTSYSATGLNYANRIKDMRVLFVTNDILDTWENDFKYDGAFSLEYGRILVSELFVNYTLEVHDISIEVGSVISFDLLRFGAPLDVSLPPDQLGSYNVEHLEVSGIYELEDRSSVIAESFSEIRRKNWDPLDIAKDPVLGLEDSVMILQNQLEDEVVSQVTGRGYFDPVMFARVSQTRLLETGVENLVDNILTYKTQLEEEYTRLAVVGLEEARELDSYIQTYLGSQILAIVAFPVMIMSMMLTIFASESSVSRRGGEVSALRSKGASFNQIFAAFMWESVILSIVGFVSGIFLSFLMAPLIGSSLSLFVFDPSLYVTFLTNLSIPPLGLIIAAALALYLPAAYLLHVARQIDITEIGQPTTELEVEDAEEVEIWPYAAGLVTILGILLAMPVLVPPIGSYAIGEILGATAMFFGAAYLSSRVIRFVTAKLSEDTNFLLGEKKLYVSQSLRKRKGRSIPLLVILILTLGATTMMVVQTSSFEATLDNELRYSIGTDLRVECEQKPLSFRDVLLQYSTVTSVTPVLQTTSYIGENTFFLEGVDAEKYSEMAYFSEESIVSDSPKAVFEDLSETPNGIVISRHYQSLWDLSLGDTIRPDVRTSEGVRAASFEIVGIMRSAPGFGAASPNEIAGSSLASQLDFQIGQGGFAVVNLDFLSNLTSIDTSDLFLVDTTEGANLGQLAEVLNQQVGITAYTVESIDISGKNESIGLFLSGIQGLTTISFFMCAAMGFAAILLFLGSEVRERKKEYAILRAIGGTQRQLVSLVLGEFASIVVVAIVVSFAIGSIFAYVLSILTFGISSFSPILPVVFSYPLDLVFLILLSQSGILLASCYLPAKKAGSTNPAVILRNL